jgi:hypothetical protein
MYNEDKEYNVSTLGITNDKGIVSLTQLPSARNTGRATVMTASHASLPLPLIPAAHQFPFAGSFAAEWRYRFARLVVDLATLRAEPARRRFAELRVLRLKQVSICAGSATDVEDPW